MDNLSENFKAKHIKRFYAQVKEQDGHLLWTGRQTLSHYGVLRVGPTHERVHRIAFFMRHGYVPPLVRHLCQIKLCVSWEHLASGTQQENVQDYWRTHDSRESKFYPTAELSAKMSLFISLRLTKWQISRILDMDVKRVEKVLNYIQPPLEAEDSDD